MSATPVDFNKMNVAQLKGALKERNLETDGKKTDLVARLEKFEKEKAEKEAEAAQEEEEEEEEEEMATDIKEEENEEEEANGDAEDEPMEEGDKEEADVKEEDEEEDKEDESKKEEKKDDGPDYTLNAKEGFVLALSSGRKVVIPDKDIIQKDLKSSSNPKTVVVYPITIEDLSDCNFQEFFESCIHFQVTFQESNKEKEKSSQGYVEFVFASQEQATEQAELMSQVRDGLNIKHFTAKDRIEDLPLPKENNLAADVLLKRFLYIGNLPPTATEQALQELFPDAVRLSIINNEEGLPKGYALAEMQTDEACDRATKMYMNVEFENYTLVVLRAWTKPPKGLLDAATRTDLLGQVKKLRLKLRGKAMMNAFARRKIDNETAAIKQRLDKDCKVREELSLPVPPDVVRREELLKEIEEKKKEDKEKNKDKASSGGSGDKKSTPAKKSFSRNSNSVPYKRPMSGAGNRGRSFMRGGGRGSFGTQGYGSQGYRSGYGGGSSGQYFGQGAAGGGEDNYGQAVEMLMQVSKMLGRGQSAGSGYGGSGYGPSSGGYGGSGYGSSSGSGFGGGSLGGGYGYGSGTQRGGAKRQAEDDGFGGGKRGPGGFKNQRRW